MPERRAGALAQRLAALLCLTGAGVFGLSAAIVGGFDRIPKSTHYRLPGGAALDPAAVTVLVVCAALFALCGIALLLLAPAPLRTAPASRSVRRRPALVLVLGIAALLAVVAARRAGF